ncbi:hypothetical protein [Bradyrhizobium sp. CIR3A]|uniref:hypothetical protein n=1 Tax=Bradyrhizobium sp. CIR3A TaxID=2663838 RepID=UPI001606A59F|nr:hypothetical protein [Bradyrhizobium sp. CIR3A]MBB4264369.1 hypothetical protein [Bradyrhizobium sp. CIR3A]
MTNDGAGLHYAMQSSATEQYEILRAAALGAVLPPEARSGLTILLHRGIWAWTRAILREPCPRQPIAVPLRTGLPIADETSERHTIIHLLAAIVMAIPDRKTA